MTREEAVRILHDCNEQYFHHPKSLTVTLDGDFSVDQLEALAMALRDRSIFTDAYP